MSEEIIDAPTLPYDIMERAKSQYGVLYSDIINDKFLVSNHEGIDNLVAKIHRLIGLAIIDANKLDDEIDGEDYNLHLTKTGLALLLKPHE